jgi:gluconolactonase
MKTRLTAALLVLTSIHAAAQIPTAPGATLKLAADGFKFTEGPAADAKGDVYFTDQPNDRIHKWTAANGKVETFLQPCGRANGLYFGPDGMLVACADENSELRRIDPATKEFTVLVSGYNSKLFNGPNDAWVHPQGGIYFTDPFVKRSYWKNREAPEQEAQRVFFLPKDAKAPIIADDTLVMPNGIIGSADGKYLYVADIRGQKTFRYRISKDGRITDRHLFCEMGSDGMTLDEAGNLYLTGKGVTVFDKKGEKLGEIPVPESWTANITFGGPERKTLFITAMDSVYTMEMAVKGQ